MKVIVQIAKYGQFLSSRPEGREAALAALAYLENLRNSTEAELNFTDVIMLAPSWLSEFIQTLRDHGIQRINYQDDDNPSVQLSVKTILDDSQKDKVHPWRVCAAGEHAVRTHSMHTKPSKAHPDGGLTTRHIHCARNPSGKDHLYSLEINEIADQHFENLSKKPCSLDLKFPNGSKFDDLIAGWVQYWNEVLNPDESLDPNLVKALIASESGFNPLKLSDKKDANSARGLMQITNDTRKILRDESGELTDHFVSVTKKELNDPNVNICSGVRWLFRKRDLASAKLRRKATWTEAAEEYKGDLQGLMQKNARSQKDVKPFLKYLSQVQKCVKS